LVKGVGEEDRVFVDTDDGGVVSGAVTCGGETRVLDGISGDRCAGFVASGADVPLFSQAVNITIKQNKPNRYLMWLIPISP
jgi:hypothetical protein